MHIQSNLNSLNIYGLFTMADLNLFLSLQNSSDSSRKQILKKIFYFIMKLYVVCTHRGNSNEYTQHTIIV